MRFLGCHHYGACLERAALQNLADFSCEGCDRQPARHKPERPPQPTAKPKKPKQEARKPEVSASGLPDRGFLKVKEVAGYFGVSASTIYAWLAEGRLEYIKIVRTVRIPREAVLKLYLNEGGKSQ